MNKKQVLSRLDKYSGGDRTTITNMLDRLNNVSRFKQFQGDELDLLWEDIIKIYGGNELMALLHGIENYLIG